MENQRILVIGGSGYIGQALTEKLKENGYWPVVLSRNLQTAKPTIKGDVLNKNFLLENLRGFDIIIYLAAIIKTLNKKKYRENVIGIQNTIEVMKINGLKKLLYFSTQNVHLKKGGPYSRSKKAAEKAVKESGLDYLIIRPNYVYGPDKNNYFYRLYKIMKIFKICPVIGRGQNIIEPINKNDLANTTIQQLKNWQSRKIIDASGQKGLTINEIVKIIKNQAKIKCLNIRIPIFIAKMFKPLIPFDLDGFTENRVPPANAMVVRGQSDFEEDIKKIIAL